MFKRKKKRFLRCPAVEPATGLPGVNRLLAWWRGLAIDSSRTSMSSNNISNRKAMVSLIPYYACKLDYLE
jgi:hypothetical protein